MENLVRADEPQRRILTRMLAPRGLDGRKHEWVLTNARSVVNPIAAERGLGRKLTTQEVRDAFEDERIFTAIQVYCLLSKAAPGLPDREDTRGFESLARIAGGPDGMTIIPPGHFLGAMTSDMHRRMGTQFIRDAFALTASMRKMGYHQVTPAVNVSEPMLHGDLAGIIADAAHESGLPPNVLELELLEHITLSERRVDAMRDVAKLGARIVLDDVEPCENFPELHSPQSRARHNLQVLVEPGVPVDGIKIPGECTCGMSRKSDPLHRSEAIAETLAFGRQQGIHRIIVEGGPAGATREDLRQIKGMTNRMGFKEEDVLFEGSVMG